VQGAIIFWDHVDVGHMHESETFNPIDATCFWIGPRIIFKQ